MDISEKVEEYMNMEYNYMVQPINDSNGTYYFAHVLEFDGCQSTGDTFEEAYVSLKVAMRGWISQKLLEGGEVPLPKTEDTYSGKFVLRIPKSLHFKLSVEAEKEGVSLNQYALYKLSK